MAMIRRIAEVLTLALSIILFFSTPTPAEGDILTGCAAPQKTPKDPSTQLAVADALLEESGLENYKKAFGIYQSLAERNPKCFEFHWKCAKACRKYGYQARKLEIANWKDICAEYGKRGMRYAEKAIRLAPEKPQGYLFYAVNVGTYADGVSVFTALREGLKDKTLNNLQKAYEIDKTLEKGGPILCLGRFWHKVPWPFRDEEKALDYYREYQQSPFFGKRIEGHVFLAELLLDKWGRAHKREAKELLEAALSKADEPYWRKQVRELLDEI